METAHQRAQRESREESDRPWAEAFVSDKFGGPLQARRGELLDVLALPGFIAERDDRTIGLATYRLENDECEIAFIATVKRYAGVGTALLKALVRAVSQCDRIWLVTTNDNLEALHFYQRRGFVLSPLPPGAVDRARKQLNLRSRRSASSESRCATKSNSSCGKDAEKLRG
jgi:ribosomal protein S18 acetylase RimI-like enzyme